MVAGAAGGLPTGSAAVVSCGPGWPALAGTRAAFGRRCAAVLRCQQGMWQRTPEMTMPQRTPQIRQGATSSAPSDDEVADAEIVDEPGEQSA